MKLKLTLSILLICLLGKSFSQSTSCVDSSSRFLLQSGTLRISIADNDVLSDSSVIIAGNLREQNQTENYLFISRLDKNNNILFSKKMNGFTGVARKIIECNNGDILIVAWTTANFRQTPWLFRFTRNGNLIWQKQVEIIGMPFINTLGTIVVYENSSGNIYIGMACTVETDAANAVLSGYYYIYKLNSSGNSIWKTTLIQNENSTNYINAIKEENGVVSFITQQYIGGTFPCNSTDFKSVSLLLLNDITGAFNDSKAYCLNFSGVTCGNTIGSTRHSAIFMPNGKIIISGQASTCSEHPLFTLETDRNFSVINCYSYRYTVPFVINYGRTYTNRFGQISLFSTGYNDNNFLYTTFNTNGTINRQRKLQLPAGTTNSPGSANFAYRKSDKFLVFSNFFQNNNAVLQIMEFKGDNNGTADCTGQDTTFITSQPHTVVPIPFTLDTIRTESFISLTTSFTLSDFFFQRNEICSSVSICDSLKINGTDTVCLDNPQKDFFVLRNPGCNKVPEWKIDTSAILSLQTLNDTTVRIKFKRQWQGYLYAYSNSCSNLLDSFYIKVFPPTAIVNLGRDTTFCSPINLDAGNNFFQYQWQDNSTNRFYNVTGPGIYHVKATDYCGNVYRDTIVFYLKKSSIFLGSDTCISHYPYTITADSGFKNYQWQDASINSRLTVNGPGLYYVSVKNFCNETYEDSIHIYKRIEPFSLGIDTFLCPGNTIQLQAPSGHREYLWQDGSTGFVFQATTAGTYWVTVTDYCGKKFSDTIKIIQLNKRINLGPDISICKKEKVQLSGRNTFSSYLWTPAYNISNTTSQTTIVYPEQTTTYYVKALTAEGCISRDTIVVSVKDCPQTFYVPSAFTPNNDGRNDLFKPIVIAPLEQYEFIIYNRWGQIIFSSLDKAKGWNGKLSGIEQNSGSFIWTCRYKFFDQPAEFKKGTFMLIR